MHDNIFFKITAFNYKHGFSAKFSIKRSFNVSRRGSQERSRFESRERKNEVINLENIRNYKSKKKEVIIRPKNLKQEEYLDALNDYNNRVIFATGPAGTGKTLLAVMRAIKSLKNGEIDKIVITRPAIGVEEDLGYLPGDMVEKMAPWTRPVIDVFMEYYTKEEVTTMLYEEIIEICPLAYIRGRTFKNCIIIADEFQNCTVEQAKAALTRIGEYSRMFVTGDLNQSDIRQKNGLADFIERIKSTNVETNGVSFVEFEKTHIERDPIVATILGIYGDDE